MDSFSGVKDVKQTHTCNLESYSDSEPGKFNVRGVHRTFTIGAYSGSKEVEISLSALRSYDNNMYRETVEYFHIPYSDRESLLSLRKEIDKALEHNSVKERTA